MAAWTGWEKDVLAAGGWPDTAANVRFLATWHTYEESNCKNNPLNTTEPWPFAVDCNPVGVKSYGAQSDGAKATVATLKNGHYPDIVAALHSGAPFTYAGAAAVATQVTTWGTPLFAAWYLTQTGTPQQGTTQTTSPDAATASGHRGYADLRNSVARHLPTQLHRSRIATDATLRLLGHGRKVKH